MIDLLLSMDYGNSTTEGIYGIVDDGGADPSQSFVFGQGASTVLTPKAGLERLIIQVGRDEGANHDLATIWATGQGGSRLRTRTEPKAPEAAGISGASHPEA